jgi:carbon monoxide dehydrogenase subunit G
MKELRGVVLGAGNDRLSGSRAAGEIEYVLLPAGGGTRVELVIRALLAGPLAQFGRSGIVEDLVSRVAQAFARNLEAASWDPVQISKRRPRRRSPRDRCCARCWRRD